MSSYASYSPPMTWAQLQAIPATGSGNSYYVKDIGVNGSIWIDTGSWTCDSDLIQIGYPAFETGFIMFSGAASGVTYSQSGYTMTVTATAHKFTNLQNGAAIYLTISGGTASSGWYSNFTYIDANTFSCTAIASISSTSGNIINYTGTKVLPYGQLTPGSNFTSLNSWQSLSGTPAAPNWFYLSNGIYYPYFRGITFDLKLTGSPTSSTKSFQPFFTTSLATTSVWLHTIWTATFIPIANSLGGLANPQSGSIGTVISAVNGEGGAFYYGTYAPGSTWPTISVSTASSWAMIQGSVYLIPF